MKSVTTHPCGEVIHSNIVEWRLENNIVPYKYSFTVYFCDVRSPIANAKCGVAMDLAYLYKFCLMIFCSQGHSSFVRLQTFFILFEHFNGMNVSATKSLVQRKWKLFSQVVNDYFKWTFCLHLPWKGNSRLLQNAHNDFDCNENLRSHWNCRLFTYTSKLNITWAIYFSWFKHMIYTDFLECSKSLL